MLIRPSYVRILCGLCTAYCHLYGPIHCACIHLQTVNLHLEWGSSKKKQVYYTFKLNRNEAEFIDRLGKYVSGLMT
jgi:hypothetical protein